MLGQLWKILTAAALAGCATYGYPGSGVVRTEIRDVPPFTVLAVHDYISFTVTENKQRTRHDVKLTIDDNLSRFVTTQVVNGRLDVRVVGTIAPRQLALEVNGPVLQGYVATTRARGTVNSMTGFSRVNFDLSAGGEISVANLEGDIVNATLASGGALELKAGTVSSLLMTSVASNSKVTADNLRAGRVDAVLTGASSARVNAVNRINASLSDSSTLFYKGNPQINQQVMTGNSRLVPLQ